MEAPSRKTTADVAAAGHRRQIMEMPQQPVGGESLQDAERKGGAADAAAGEAERGSRNRHTANALIKLEHIGRRRAVRDARIAGMQLTEFLIQHPEQRQGLCRGMILRQSCRYGPRHRHFGGHRSLPRRPYRLAVGNAQAPRRVRLIERAERNWLAWSARLPLIRRSKPWSSPPPCRRTRDSNRRSPAMDQTL